jgi:hypothetical protein
MASCRQGLGEEGTAIMMALARRRDFTIAQGLSLTGDFFLPFSHVTQSTLWPESRHGLRISLGSSQQHRRGKNNET